MDTLHPSPKQAKPLRRQVLLVALLVLVSLLAGTQVAAAQSDPDTPFWPVYLPQVAGGMTQVTGSDGSGNADVIYNVGCMEESAGFGLNCTANDISIASATNIAILDDGCAYPGDTVTFKADFEVLLTAQARYDIGLWFAQDGDPNGDAAKTGMCTAATPAYAPDPPWLDLDQTESGQANDTCGDINDAHNPLYPSVTLTVQCVDDDANGKLDLPNCTSWRQPGDNSLCTMPQEAVPGAPSKCKCDTGFNVDIPVPGQIIVDKVTYPAGDPTFFNFTITGGPAPAVNVPFSLADASAPYKSSKLFAGIYSVAETTNPSYATNATCSDGSPANAVDLQPGEIVTCTFTNKLLTGSLTLIKVVDNLGQTGPGYLGVGDFPLTIDGAATTSGTPAVVLAGDHTIAETNRTGYSVGTWTCTDGTTGTAGSESATVNVSGGENVSCTMTNTLIAGPHLSIVKLADKTSYSAVGEVIKYTIVATNDGNVTLAAVTVSDPIVTGLSCIPTNGSALAPGESMTCIAEHTVTQADIAAGHFANTACVDDGELGASQACDDEDVFENVPPTVDLVKDVSPATLPEPGGVFNYTLVINNTSSEAVKVTALTDSNPLPAECTGLIGQVIAAGGSLSCSYSVTHVEAGTYPNTASVTVQDNEGSTASDTDAETVAVTDVAPTVDLVKDVSPATLPEPGGVFNYTLVINNTSSEAVKVTALTDDNPLPAECTGLIGQVIAAGGSLSCSYSVTHVEAGTYPNTASVTVQDNEGSTASDTDAETVAVTDVAPTVDLVKDVSPATLPEPGGVFNYTLVINNTSSEAVKVTALTDSNPLPAECTGLIGQVIAAGGSLSCSYSVTHVEAGTYPNTASVTVQDNEGSTASDTDAETVAVTDVAPTVDLVKDVSPATLPEPGGVFNYTLVINNTSSEAVKVTALTDDNPLPAECTGLIGQVIAAGGSLSCSYSVTHVEAGTYPNTASVTVQDNEGSTASDTDAETVTVTDVLPDISVLKTADPTSVPETGANVVFTFKVTNNGLEAATISSLSDSVYGALTGDADCQVGTVLASGASCEFSITRWVAGDFSGDDHYNVFTGKATDNDGNEDTATDDETVTLTDVLPDISVLKTADPTSVPETGANVVFTFKVTNNGLEAATISSLSDSVYGALTGDADCQVGTVLASGASCEFSITRWVAGDFSGDDHYNVFTGKATDNDGNEDTATDDETVTLTDVLPDISVLKTADPTSVPETGANVVFTFKVTNNGLEAATISSLSDSVYGALTGDADCQVGTVLASGASCEFSITRWVAGDFSGDDHYNVFTGKATDNDGNEDTATDDETVTLTDVLPDISVLKTADPTSVPETGANVVFTFKVTNNGLEAATISSLSDSVYGALTGDADCQVGTVLASGASCEFSITRWVAGDFSGDDHYNVFTGKATDNDGNEDTATDDETVTLTDVLPDISVLKTADPTSVPETGANVVFTFKVTNNGLEAATISSLSDSVYGALTGDADCQVGTVLAGGASCSFSATFAIPAGDYPGSHVNTFTAVGADDDGNSDSGSDSETVVYTDVLPDITVVKTAEPTSVPETGNNVKFTIVVTNNSSEAAAITALTDDKFGTLAGDADCKVGTELAAGASCTFEFTKFVAGDFESRISHVNTATVVASDNDGNTDEASDDATVDFTNVTADIDVEKLVSVDGGMTWVDADSPFGPYAVQGNAVQFKFVVTNAGSAVLTNISLTDSDFSLAGCAIPAALLPGALFECSISTTAALGQHTDTGTVSGSFVDGAGNTESDSDTDDANYYGVSRGQPSIQINSLSINIAALKTVTGQFNITDESTGSKQPDGFMVALTDYGVRWEQKSSSKNSKFAPVVPSGGCNYTLVSIDGTSYNRPLAPGEDIIFDETVNIGYSCTFGSGQLLKGGTLRGTAYAGIFGRTDREFTYSSTASIPKTATSAAETEDLAVGRQLYLPLLGR